MSASVVMRHLQTLLERDGLGRLADGRLLDRFVAQADEAAFAELVRRHGPLVLSVCRRVLGDPSDAEDAFQAAFLVLARKAASIRKSQSVGSWLYGVAYRLALRLRQQRARRQARETAAAAELPASDPDPLEQMSARELLDVLDEELARLPEKYRQPLVLCHLQGQTTHDAAQLLSQPHNTLKTRLVRGRELLHRRLARRGLVLSSAALALVLTRSASAAVPAALAQKACRVVFDPAAAVRVPALAEAALRAMLVHRLRVWLVALAALGMAVLGVTWGGSEVPGTEEAPIEPQMILNVQAEPLPPDAVARLGTTRLRHGHVLLALGFEAGDRTLVTVTHRRTVHRWDRATGRELSHVTLEIAPGADLACSPTQPHEELRAPNAITLSSDGRLLAALTLDGKVRLWDLDTGRLRGQALDVEGGAFSLAFLPGDKGLLAQGDDGGVTHYDLKDDRVVRRFGPAIREGVRTSRGVASRMAVSADGRVLAAAVLESIPRIGVSRTVLVWEVDSGREVFRGRLGAEANTFAPTLSPDGARLAWPTEPSSVVCVELATGEQTVLEGSGAVPQVAFSSDGRSLLVRRIGDRTVTVWEPGSGQTRRLNDQGQGEGWLGSAHLPAGNPLQVSGDGRWLALPGSSGTVLVLDLVSGREAHPVVGHQSVLELVRVSADGREVLTHGVDGVVRRWDAGDGEERGLLRAGEPVCSVVHAPDYSALVRHVPGTATFAICDGRGKTRRQCTVETALSSFGELRFVFSPDGRWLAVRSRWDDALWLFETATGELRHLLREPRFGGLGSLEERVPQPVLVQFSPDGARVGALGADGRFRWWEVDSGRQRLAFTVAENPQLEDAAVSPDGQLLAIDLGDAVGLWELSTGRLRRYLGRTQDPAPRGPLPHQAEVWPQAPQRLVFSPDGRLLARVEAERAIRLWEVHTSRPLGRLEGHAGEVTSLAFTPDSRRLVSASADTTALVWDLGRIRASLSSEPQRRGSSAALERLVEASRSRPPAGVWDLGERGLSDGYDSSGGLISPARLDCPGACVLRSPWPTWSSIRTWGHGWAAGWGAGREARPPGIAARPVAAASA